MTSTIQQWAADAAGLVQDENLGRGTGAAPSIIEPVEACTLRRSGLLGIMAAISPLKSSASKVHRTPALKGSSSRKRRGVAMIPTQASELDLDTGF